MLDRNFFSNFLSKSIMKFGITGVFSNLISYIIYFFSLFIFELNFSVFFGYFSGFVFSYYTNKNWTFKLKIKDKSSINIEKIQYVILHIISVFLMIILVNFFNFFINLNYTTLWFFSAIPVACMNYVISKKIFS